ncbi:ATP-binding cassette domain-containing protein [Kineococcus sp. SYSU DK002]|uniref:ATP-binding cassette domain-containing protein n=1 Tax=Kineococcus sp. SYSU DK002 TaxID=3383123 RepID=UPI003D7EC42C
MSPDLPRPLGRGRRARFALLVGLGVAQAALTVQTALLVRRGFDVLLAPGPGPSPTATVVGLVVAALLVAALRGAERVVAEDLGQHYAEQVRDTLFRHLTDVPARTVGGLGRGGLLSRFVGDLTALRTWVSLGLARLVVSGLVVVLVLAALVVLDPRTGLAVAAVLLTAALATAVVSPWLVRATANARRHRARFTGEVTERLDRLATVQAFAQTTRERDRLRRKGSAVVDAAVARAGATGAARAVAESGAGLATVAALVAGAASVRAGATGPGTVVAAVSVAGLLASHLRDLGRVAEHAAAARVARAAARRTLAVGGFGPGADRLRAPEGAVRLRGVRFGDALGGSQGITAAVAPGRTVALVGPNGAGKSTLAALLARLVDPDEGAVELDGTDLRTVTPASVHRVVGVAGPDLPLLRGSLRRNVTYRRPRCGEAELRRVAALCDLGEVVSDLGGWDADVGPGGRRLSAGQRGRVALARAVLGGPRVLVLDEAEAHLDERAAAVVEAVLRRHRGTAFVVTHRRRTLELADEVWCLVDGRIVESGPPDRLLTAGGPTARLFGGA